MTLTLVPIATDPPEEPVESLLATLDWDPEQPAERHALHLWLRITNEGAATVELDNPYEGVTYQVTDGGGWPVTSPAPPRAAKIHGPRRSPEAKSRYLACVEATVDGTPLSHDQAIGAPSVELSPGATLAYELAIGTVRSAPDSATFIAPDEGEYHVSLLLPLAWTDGTTPVKVLLRADGEATIKLVATTPAAP